MSQKIPVITADLQPDSLRDLQSQLDGIFSDGPLEPIGLPHIDPTRTAAPVPADFSQNDGNSISKGTIQKENPQFDPKAIALILFTSGSTGKKKRIEKPFSSLFEEIKNLENVFGNSVRGLSRRSTVSHFHIYGFLFNILWPMHFGHLICESKTFYWEQVLANGEDGACIVSSPAHLRVLCDIAKTHPFNWKKSIIFSSGGPLSRGVSLKIKTETGVSPTEIFGATETGGIAWRCQHPDKDTPFQPFPDVAIRKNQVNGLEVLSPWLDSPGEWMETGDLVEFAAHATFFIQGRYDTIVKIAGKRVSITEMEQTLRQMKEIEDVKIFQYQDNTQDIRSVLAAVIIPATGHDIPKGASKREMVKHIKGQLTRRFDLVTLPRFWRFVLDFPRDLQGKVTLKLLQEIVRDGR